MNPVRGTMIRRRVFPLKPLVFIFLLLLSLFVSMKLRNRNLAPIKAVSLSPQQNVLKNSQELTSVLKNIISKKEGTYSVFFEDFTLRETVGINEEMIVTAASVNKIPILAALYYLADQGEIDLERRITLQEKDIQDYGTGIIRYDKPGTVYSLKTLARLMMEKSDNTASYILASQVIGLNKLQKLVDSWGLKQTDMVKNKTSNKDMAKLLKLMFQGKIAKQALTSEMIGFMDDSDFEDRLPTSLSHEIKVYHKIGNEIGFVHDVGIIDLENKPYYLGILTSDISNEEEATKTIAEISRLVFDYQKSIKINDR